MRLRFVEEVTIDGFKRFIIYFVDLVNLTYNSINVLKGK